MECAAFGCPTYYKDNPERKFRITYHRFPKDEALRRKWMQALGRERDLDPSSKAFLCSRHFKEDCLIRTSLVKVKLRRNAIPTIFSAFPAYVPRHGKAFEEGEVPFPAPMNKDIADSEDFQEVEKEEEEEVAEMLQPSETFEQPNQKQKLDLGHVKLSASRKIISTSLQTQIHYVKKNAGLQNVIDDLRKNNLLYPNSLCMLESCAGGKSDLLKRHWSGPAPPSLELQNFARTLYMYSPHAYSYVKNKFDTVLPSPGVMQMWCSAFKRRKIEKGRDELLDIVNDLRENGLLGTNSLVVLQNCATGQVTDLQRQATKVSNKLELASYPPKLRRFALTLYLYSPYAYRYVKRKFNTKLPHPSVLEKWYEAMESKPGFTPSALSALSLRSAMVRGKGKPVLCSLIMGEMTLSQPMEWDGQECHGYTNLETTLDCGSLSVVEKALTFMVVSINDHWKMPIGYFLIDGTRANERSHLLIRCLERLYGAGIEVVSVTLDGAGSSFSEIKNLGCNLDPADLITSFHHPVTKAPVFVFLDSCHMLKLVGNALSEEGAVTDGENQYIKWQYIESLHNLQESEELHLHDSQFQQKKAANLASQLLSESVACSLEFCLQGNCPDFKGCEATINFIRLFSRMFEILNSRNLNGSGWSCPIQEKNYVKIVDFLEGARSYILSLKQSNSQLPLVKCNRKTGFLGFVVCIDSLLSLYKTLISSHKYSLRFLLTYSFSQDHLELFFKKLQSLEGCNDDQTAKQFATGYKRLTTDCIERLHAFDIVHGNCVPLQSGPALPVSSDSNNSDSDVSSIPAVSSVAGKKKIIEHCTSKLHLIDHDYGCNSLGHY